MRVRFGPAAVLSAAGLLGITVVATLSPPPAGATDPAGRAGGLVSSAPADSAVVTRAPNEVDLTFSARPDPGLSHVTAWNVVGQPLDSGDLVAAGDTLRQPVSVEGPGTVTVAYHVVFTDGRDAVGVVRFSVGTGVPPPPPSSPPPAVQQADEAVARQHDHGVDPVGGALLAVDAIVLLGVVALLLRRPPGAGPGSAR